MHMHIFYGVVYSKSILTQISFIICHANQIQKLFLHIFYILFFLCFVFFPEYVESVTVVHNCHITLTFSLLTSMFILTLFIAFLRLFFGLYHLLFPSMFIFSTFSLSIPYFLKTFQSHLNLLSFILFIVEDTPILFFILFFSGTPIFHLNIPCTILIYDKFVTGLWAIIIWKSLGYMCIIDLYLKILDKQL